MNKATMFRSQDNDEFPARTAFWGIRCEPGKKYSQVVRQKFRITNAALEPSEVTTRTTDNFVSLMAVHGGQEYLLCSLQQKNIMQVNLNLVFDQGDNLIFHLKGQGRVHLSGYLISDGDEPCPLKISAVPDSPQQKQNQNLKKKSPVQNQPAIKNKEVVTVPDNIDEPSNEKTATRKRKAKAQLTSNAVKKKENADKVSEDELHVQEIDVKKTKKEAIMANSGAIRLWNTLQQRQENDEDEKEDDNGEEKVKEEDDDVYGDDEDKDDNEEEEDDDDSEGEEGNSKDRSHSKQPQQKLSKTDSKLKRKENFHAKSAEVVDLEVEEDEDEEEDSSSSEGVQELNSSIGRTPMPSKKMYAVQSLHSPSLQFKSHESKRKKQKNEKRDVSILKVNKGNTVEKPFGKKLASGVDIRDIRIGSGPPAKIGKLIHMYYVGKLPNGHMFDSRKPNEKPFSFRLGKGEVMHGMEIGIEGMKVGGKRKIKIPPEMGLGKQGSGVVPPNTPLHFVVELKAVS